MAGGASRVGAHLLRPGVSVTTAQRLALSRLSTRGICIQNIVGGQSILRLEEAAAQRCLGERADSGGAADLRLSP